MTTEEAFEQFWAWYPRKQDKGLARAKFLAVITGLEATVRDHDGNTFQVPLKTTAEDLIEAAKAYAYSVISSPEKYIKLPSTWLNRGCWDDLDNRADLAARMERIREIVTDKQRLRLVK